MARLRTILKGLKKIKKDTPTITCSAYRREVESTVKKENKEFAREDKDLVMSRDQFHSSFSV